MATTAVSKLAGLTTAILVSRSLGAFGLGQYALILATGEILRVGVNAGIDRALLRRLSVERKSAWRELRLSVVSKVIVATAATAIGVAIWRSWGHQPVIAVGVALLGLDLVINGISLSISTYFCSQLQSRRLIVPTTSAAMTYVLVVALGATLHMGVLYFIACLAVNSTVLVIALIPRIRRELPRLSEPETKSGGLWWESLPITVFGLVVLTYSRIDTILLGAWSGVQQVGYYAASYRLTEAAIAVGFAVGTTAMPRFSRLGSAKREAAESYKKTLRTLTPVAVLLSAGYIVMSPTLVQTLYGPSYARTSVGVAILAVAILFMSLNNVSGMLLIAIGARGQLVSIATVVLVMNVTMNVVLIPRIGFIGCAVATVVTEGLNFGLQTAAIGWSSNSWPLPRSFFLALGVFVVAPMTALYYSGHLPPLAAFAVIALVVGGLLAAKAVTRNDFVEVVKLRAAEASSGS